jgi:hypothetical protein
VRLTVCAAAGLPSIRSANAASARRVTSGLVSSPTGAEDRSTQRSAASTHVHVDAVIVAEMSRRRGVRSALLDAVER